MKQEKINRRLSYLNRNKTGKGNAVLGAAFLMATSAIGPGFLTQTTLFTQQLLASFGCIILISILLDIGAQLNIWYVLTLSEKRAQDLANQTMPGLGYLIAFLVSFGGFMFNIGNFAGCGLGLQVLTGISPESGAALSCAIALVLFWHKASYRIMDVFVIALGVLMILLTCYVAFSSKPPLWLALRQTFVPEKFDVMKLITIIGGTVGGYISFAGAHRLMEAGIKGRNALKKVSQSAITGILTTSFMRYILFLAALGVISKGVSLSGNNPAASVFKAAAGNIGYYFFGMVIWFAALTSVVGASFTSVSFWKTLAPVIQENERITTTLFLLGSASVFIFLGNPVKWLVMAGTINGIILPVMLTIVLLSAEKKQITGDYKLPLILKASGWIVVFILTFMSLKVLAF
ncbi:MAG: divalent metal cation transporter [Chitinophagaceae bacterium]|nr:divalent metal cation transporter [Chitinophagaceae bacterium]